MLFKIVKCNQIRETLVCNASYTVTETRGTTAIEKSQKKKMSISFNQQPKRRVKK